MASCSTNAGSSEHPESSSLSGSLKVPAIFLSHSGMQKPFVQRLYDALQKVNHDPFFDKHSLPKGRLFPERIKTAARTCTLGVVVLSDDFLTSKWPMVELEILVQRRGSDPKVLPLFYKLEPKDLKSPEKLIEWRKKWEELARNPEEVVEWEKTVKGLRKFHGERFEEGTSETQYIKRVVDSICKQAPCPLPYDMSEIRGHDRLVEEVAKQFDHMRHEQQDGEACMVGLHGVGGVGKSTMCKSLVNFYWSKYPGKSYYLELPTNGTDIEIIVQKCNKALEALADVDEMLLKKASDIEQLIGLMKEHLAQHDVFLAIDNVWESSREVVEKILKVGFSSKSKILVTSCSEEVLKELFWDQKNSHVSPLPALNREEAFQIFQDALRLGDLNSLVKEMHLVDGALKRCEFGYTYHALALKALGLHVKNVCALEGLGDLSRILGEIKSIDLPKRVEDVIRRSYDSLEKQKKHMFLDIALLPAMRGTFGRITVEKVYQLLNFLYKDQSKGKTDIILKSMIRELCLDGLLQLETDGLFGEKIIKVHDLLYDVAESEAARSSRFFIAGRSSRAVEDIQWQELERVTLHGFCNLQFIEKLQRQLCRRLQVLDVSGVEFSQGIDMLLMPALCVLKLHDVSLRSVLNWPASALVIIDLEDICFHHMPAMEGIEGLGTLKTLEGLCLVRCKALKGTLDLCGLSSSLRDVRIEGCGALERLPDMSGLTRLEKLEIFVCQSLMGIPDLSGLAGLDRLMLWGNGSMKEVGGLSSSLRDVQIWGCGALERVPDMSGLTRLEKLTIFHCESLKGIPDLSGLARLDRLYLSGNRSLEEVGGLSSSLRGVRIRKCGPLERVPDMSRLTRLEILDISHCGSLKGIPDLSGLAGLDRLMLWGNRSMEEVGSLSSSLRDVTIVACYALKKVPDISGLTRLERLELHGNQALEEVEGQSVSSTLTELCIAACPRLRRFPEGFERLCAHLSRAE